VLCHPGAAGRVVPWACAQAELAAAYVAGRSTAQQRAVAAAGVESWLSEHEARIQKRGTAVVSQSRRRSLRTGPGLLATTICRSGLARAGSAQVPDRCGFLAKTTRSGVSASVRWVVLEGAVLSYFADRAEVRLRALAGRANASGQVPLSACWCCQWLCVAVCGWGLADGLAGRFAPVGGDLLALLWVPCAPAPFPGRCCARDWLL